MEEKGNGITVNLDEDTFKQLEEYQGELDGVTFVGGEGPEAKSISYPFRKTGNENVKSESNVDHPSHYNKGKYEVIDVIADWKLNFALGNVIKYVARAPFKGNQREDLEKAMWYLKYHIDHLE